MVYRLVLDETVEHEVYHRLDNYGHDVEHVDFVAELGKGTDDNLSRRFGCDVRRDSRTDPRTREATGGGRYRD